MRTIAALAALLLSHSIGAEAGHHGSTWKLECYDWKDCSVAAGADSQCNMAVCEYGICKTKPANIGEECSLEHYYGKCAPTCTVPDWATYGECIAPKGVARLSSAVALVSALHV
jgi:hypothetical protein